MALSVQWQRRMGVYKEIPPHEWPAAMKEKFGELVRQTFLVCGIDRPVCVVVKNSPRNGLRYNARSGWKGTARSPTKFVIEVYAPVFEEWTRGMVAAILAHEAWHLLAMMRRGRPVVSLLAYLMGRDSFLEEARADRFSYRLFGKEALEMRRCLSSQEGAASSGKALLAFLERTDRRRFRKTM